ncbi:MepB family protein [Psychrobacter sp. AOP22-C1-22]|uniref:MepB family protein n=1 Tax=unclassified Psychrobacter TaxID=196806 RepID=UPI001788542E|nr:MULTISPECIES: MepB family protein [unclassified Psychrobacter]MBE0406089.1 MepB family protein [Psychrobacter sp. FME6]MBE0444207.1 MepB family protein [Psychrobacter sp. FME5]
MHVFSTVLEYINEFIYKPNQLTAASAVEEKQNSEYAAGRFELSCKSAIRTVRFRVAKQTPSKVGQFVTFWEKDDEGANQPFQYNESPDLLVITTFKDDNTLGQFVFPKDILLKNNILKSHSTKGKMGIRVYPSWDKPTSKTAIRTQNWQLDYFFTVADTRVLPSAKILELYE